MRNLRWLPVVVAFLLLISCKHNSKAAKLNAQREEAIKAAILKLMTRYLTSSESAPFGDPNQVEVTVKIKEAPEDATEVPFRCDISVGRGTRRPKSAEAVPEGLWVDHLQGMQGLSGTARFDGEKVSQVTFEGTRNALEFTYKLDVAKERFNVTFRGPGGLHLLTDIKP